MLGFRTTLEVSLAGAMTLALLLGGVSPAMAHTVPDDGFDPATELGAELEIRPEVAPDPAVASHGPKDDGTISGRVRDPRQLAIPNEKFTVVAFQGRNLTQVIGVSDEANDAGDYRIDGLPRAKNITLLLMSTGVHSSAVAEMGWQNSYNIKTFDYVNLAGGDAFDIDFTMQPGFADICLFSEFCNRFYKEIMWMRASGISTGVRKASGSHGRTTQHYMPRDTVSREAMAAFLYRLNTPNGAKGPVGYTIPTKTPFADVPTHHKFYKEIAWMHQSGLSTGIKHGGTVLYAPKSGVSREAMAAFMFRMEKPS